MLLSTHALVGAAIGKHIGSPWLIILVSLIVHFIIDSFRHGEYSKWESATKDIVWKATLDLLIGFSIIILYFNLSSPDILEIRNIFIGVFASVFPDFLTFLYRIFNFKFLKKIYQFHTWIHHQSSAPQGIWWHLRNIKNNISLSILSIIILIL